MVRHGQTLVQQSDSIKTQYLGAANFKVINSFATSSRKSGFANDQPQVRFGSTSAARRARTPRSTQAGHPAAFYASKNSLNVNS